MMNFGTFESTVLESFEEIRSSVIAVGESSCGIFETVFGRSGGLRREVSACANLIGAGFGSFEGGTTADFLVAQEVSPGTRSSPAINGIMRQIPLRATPLTREVPRRGVVKNAMSCILPISNENAKT